MIHRRIGHPSRRSLSHGGDEAERQKKLALEENKTITTVSITTTEASERGEQSTRTMGKKG